MVDDTERNLCLFRQMEAAAIADQELPIDSDVVRAIATPKEFSCKVGGCAIRGQELIDYMFSDGSDKPRANLDDRAANSCQINDLVSQRDTDGAEIANSLDELRQTDL